jgi:DNA polymerase-3 subunit epsilon
MTILTIDTETDGFHHSTKPNNHPDQPRLVQIAMELITDEGAPLSAVSLVVDPGRPIPEKATAVHGITDEFAKEYGVQESAAVIIFVELMDKADLIVAHNAKFDIGVMRCAMARHGLTDHFGYQIFCTMEAATPIARIPPTEKMLRAGFTKYKSPNLGECMRIFFNEDHAGAHDALADVIACRRIYFELKRRAAL